ncbi:NRDE family protein [Neptunitalea lumnitzerae]|uniref:Transport and Golgi organisation 2 n=1 Tax=Neptunitalea lumnitzerae TaxID=2965509 RepID=A0ABQ5MIZ6_9FLAO|nr:NRDE family protein [Neptunitalea sp. Y10]GLB48912.1 hypothetical protein Y10_12800 [Neptunitalea sp. Y10]
MCTVSYIHTGTEVVITSNRDEHTNRPAAVAPQTYLSNGKQVIFPKDVVGGGTWFAIDDKGNAVVLLNGAKEKHIPKPPYRVSRGIIVTSLISSECIVDGWKSVDLNHVEPFTLVIYEDGNLFETYWDGISKHITKLNAQQPHVWSSSTLYEPSIRTIRAKWFYDFTSQPDKLDAFKILDFHKHSHSGNKEYGLQINRQGIFKTVSITQLVLKNNIPKVTYIDTAKSTEVIALFPKAAV